MPVVRISQETMERLKKWAEPLVDTTESAFVKALNTAEKALDAERNVATLREPEAVRPPDGGKVKEELAEKKILPDKEFRQPLLDILYEMGGKASRHELRPVLEERIAPRLQPGDYEPVSTGDPRWWSAASWTRNKLKDEGFLRHDSPRGFWELSEKGIRQVEAWRATEPASFINHLLAMPDAGEDSDFDQPRSASRRIEL